MADFSRTAISQNAKREYTAPIASIDAFDAVTTAFSGDATMSMTIKQTAAVYKSTVSYFNENSDKKGSVTINAEDKAQFDSLKEALESDFIAEAANGENHGGASIDSKDETWTVKFSCTNTVTVSGKEVEDTFTVSIGREYMSITGFSYEETIEKIEAWADNQNALA